MNTVWIIALLSLTLPAEYRLLESTTEHIPLIGPPGRYATQEFRAWQAPGGKTIYAFFWEPYAPRDLGPMKTEQEWPAVVAGQPAIIRETSLFMGQPHRSLVVHLSFKTPDSQAMIYATGLDPDEFRAILSGVTRK